MNVVRGYRMRTIMNNVNVICKGTIVSLLAHLTMILFLIASSFQITSAAFAILLLVAMAISGFFAGSLSKQHAELNGMLVGLLTSAILLLFIAQWSSMDWMLNAMICASYIVVGFISALVARIIARNKSLEERVFTKEKVEDTPLLKKRKEKKTKKEKDLSQKERRLQLSKKFHRRNLKD